MGMLDGKSAVITGAGRGLGREDALLLAKEGCNVLINDLGYSIWNAHYVLFLEIF